MRKLSQGELRQMSNLRIVKVHEKPAGGKYEPCIRIAGKYLLNLGFKIGDECVIFTENGKIEIRLLSELQAVRLKFHPEEAQELRTPAKPL